MDVKKERNYGIDLLRVLSMFFVVVLHSYGNGGILTNTIENTTQYKIAWFIEIIAYCAVDVFALISGYVCYKQNNNKINFSRFINLWFQVVFYGLIISLIFNISLEGYFGFVISLFILKSAIEILKDTINYCIYLL